MNFRNIFFFSNQGLEKIVPLWALKSGPKKVKSEEPHKKCSPYELICLQNVELFFLTCAMFPPQTNAILFFQSHNQHLCSFSSFQVLIRCIGKLRSPLVLSSLLPFSSFLNPRPGFFYIKLSQAQAPKVTMPPILHGLEHPCSLFLPPNYPRFFIKIPQMHLSESSTALFCRGCHRSWQLISS